MRRSRTLPILALGLLCLASTAWSQARFPPPEFESGYTMPKTAPPAASPSWTQYVDLLVLAGFLVCVSAIVHHTRRRWQIVAASLAALAYFGFYRGGCVCPIGAIQNVVRALVDSGYALPLTVAGFFVLPLVTALLFGRTFCAGVCPLGAVQDLITIHPLRVPRWLDQSLGLLPWVYLAAAVIFAAAGSAFIICQYDPFVPIFRMVPLGKIFEGWARRDPALNPWALSGRLDTLVITGAILLIGLFVTRPYCRYLCPYGVLLGLLSKVSWRHVTITPDECIQCRLCEDTCPVGAILPPTAAAPARMRFRGKAALAVALAAVPVLVVAGGALGGALAAAMARVHPTVRLADRVRAENAGQVEGTTDESKAFRASGRSADDLFAGARAVETKFVAQWRPAGVPVGLSHVFGAFVGLVAGLKLTRLGIRRRRSDYESDPATCVACTRCFAYCPIGTAWREGKQIALSKDRRAPDGGEETPSE